MVASESMLQVNLWMGTQLDGPASLRRALLSRSDVFVRTNDGETLTYASGRCDEVLRYAGRSLDRGGEAATK